MLSAAGVFSAEARVIRELLPRYQYDNLFDSTKFRTRFPELAITDHREGLAVIRDERRAADGR